MSYFECVSNTIINCYSNKSFNYHSRLDGLLSKSSVLTISLQGNQLHGQQFLIYCNKGLGNLYFLSHYAFDRLWHIYHCREKPILRSCFLAYPVLLGFYMPDILMYTDLSIIDFNKCLVQCSHCLPSFCGIHCTDKKGDCYLHLYSSFSLIC